MRNWIGRAPLAGLLLLAVLAIVAWTCSTEESRVSPAVPNALHLGALQSGAAATSAGGANERLHAVVERLDPETPRDGSVAVQLEVDPPGAPFTWRVRTFLEPIPGTKRRLVEEREGSGAARLEFAVPVGTIGVELETPDAFGPRWHECAAAARESAEVTLRVVAAGRVMGRAVDEAGAPVVGARVVMAPSTDRPADALAPFGEARVPRFAETPYSVETDADGRYVIERVDPRRTFACAVAHPSFAVARNRGVTVDAAGEAIIDFTMRSAGRVTGRLIDTDREPLAGVRIRLAQAERDGSSITRWQDEGAATTDADGRFTFGSLSAGWKKLETVVRAEPGHAVVGHWEVRSQPRQVTDLGDLVVGLGRFETRITTPEGPADALRVVAHFVPSRRLVGNEQAAMLQLPAEPDDDGIVRIDGLPAGTVSASVYDSTPRTDGRHRPRSDFGAYHDGDRTHVEWMLRDLEDGPPAIEIAKAGQCRLELRFPDRARGDLVFVCIDGALSVVSEVTGAEVSCDAVRGAQVRTVVTDGERYFEESWQADADAERTSFPAGDRAGNALEVRVHDDGRGVPGVAVMLGGARDGDGLGFVGATETDGHLTLRGLPPDVQLRVWVQVAGRRLGPFPVVWEAGKALIDVDAGED